MAINSDSKITTSQSESGLADLLFSKVWNIVRVGVSRGACDRSQPLRGTCTLPVVFHNLRRYRQLSQLALWLSGATTANFGLMKSWVQVVTSKSVVSWSQLILLIFRFSSRDKKAAHRLASKSSRYLEYHRSKLFHGSPPILSHAGAGSAWGQAQPGQLSPFQESPPEIRISN